MAKSLCKFSRREIKAGKIDKLVSESQFYCGSCARSSNQKSALCKPVSLTSNKARLGKSQLHTTHVNISSHSTLKQASNVPEVVEKAKALKAQRDGIQQVMIKPLENNVNLVIPSPALPEPLQKVVKSSASLLPQLESQLLLAPTEIKQQLKQLKKSVKEQKKQQKQMKKLLKKQRKLAKKNKKILKQEFKLTQKHTKIAKQEARIEQRLSRLNLIEPMNLPNTSSNKVVTRKSLH